MSRKYAVIFSSDDPEVYFEVLRFLAKRGCVVHYSYGPTDEYLYVVTYPEMTDRMRMLKEVRRLVKT